MSAEEKKRGWFGRLFGGGRPEEAEPAPEAEEPAEESATGEPEASGEEARPAEAPASRDEAAAAAAEAEAEEPLAPIDAIPSAPEPETGPALDVEPEAEPEAEPQPEPVAVAPVAPEAPAEPKQSWFQRLRAGLSRSSSALGQSITGLVRKRKLDDEMLQDLEDALIQADLGVDTAMRITEELARRRYDKQVTADEVRSVLAEEVEKVLKPVTKPLQPDFSHKPHVLLMVGVNGSGKTTTIGKLAAKFRADGRKVVMGAGDTFRAAAIEQLKVWGERTGATVVAKAQGSDASGVAWETLDVAKREGADIALVDTAGRLQNKAHLMDELTKIVRVIRKHDETAPHDVILVLDATTGQNAMQQVEIFRQVCGVTGLVMTKLDGTARGGILVAISDKHELPVHAIGIGEGVEDLEAFDAGQFARAIAGVAEASTEERA
ncbi:signal recognition particle-docking protein FtsY [Lutibaculum baratangense]|uniref:Signal recognition particle receptor FtsY n=1 Tax=Lutibaculum baratangense AMV1 TaxID=631454 RepID=V4RJ14_9HYPH|nr:signal recognition particle-docking protein FtsY [Lutibaculum baratangense]ESR26076.1 Signal recognition particle receptor protein FtsY [Lutibaculum baratangense AMV1]